MLDMIEKTKTVDIFNFVCQMRTQRTHMVQVEVVIIFSLKRFIYRRQNRINKLSREVAK